MRRGLAVLLYLSVLGSMTPSAFGQYPPYPYPPAYGPPGPMPTPYVPPTYGPLPPAYGPGPMPMPMPQPPAPPRPTVYVYGPLTAVDSAPPAALPNLDRNARSDIQTVQATTSARPTSESGPIRRTQMLEGASCGPLGCDACPEFGPCDPVYGNPPIRGHGRFIGEVGAYFLVPFGNSRLAYSNNGAGDSDFPRTITYGPRASVGYLSHTGWGFRGNYFYLYNQANQSTSNADPGATVTSAMGAPFQIVSPSLTLAQGIGADQFNFRQRLDINVADAELLREFHVFDMTALFSLGARYARINQTYSATRTNTGGSNGANIVTVDRENVDSSSQFEGWGPTVSMEFVQPCFKSCLSLYGNVRGSFLFGVNRFNQSYQQQRNSVDAGVPTFIDTTNSNLTTDSRTVSIGEAELGVQVGCHFGRCYVFARAGGVFQRWWDVGSPTTPNGSLSFVGGTGRLGITY